MHNLVIDPRATSKEKIAQSKVVHKLLKKLLLYSIVFCDHNLTLIKQTGLDSTFDSSRHGAPELNPIVKIVKAKEAGNYKIILEKKPSKKGVRKDPLTHDKGVLYIIEITTTPTDANSWAIIVKGVPRTKLIIPQANVTQGSKNYARVTAYNSGGTSDTGKAFPFSPEFD